MALSTTNLGNGTGFIYVVDRSGTDILYSFPNTSDGVKSMMADAVQSRNVSDGQFGVASITVDTVDAAGNTITSITVGGIDQVRTSFAYGAGLSVQQLAALIGSEINSYTNAIQDYTAVVADDTVYLYPNMTSPDEDLNGDPPLVNDVGSSAYSYSDVAGATQAGSVGSWGNRYYLYADAAATRTSFASADEITEYVVPKDFGGEIPTQQVTISSGVITPTRNSNISFVFVGTESFAPTDDLDDIVMDNAVNGDIIFLAGQNSGRVTTVTDTGNINLSSNLDFVTAERQDVIALYYRAGSWFELFRSGVVVNSDASLSGLGTAASPLSVVSAPMNFTDLPTDYGVTLSTVATSGAYSDLSGTPSKVDQISRDISFETDEVGDMKIVFYKACTVNQVDSYVDKAIEATDDATIDCKNHAGTSMGVITHTAGATIGSGANITPSSNNTFTAGEVMTLTTAKTTKGGKAYVSIKYTVS